MMSWPDFCYKQIIVHIAGGSKERLRFHVDNIVIEDADGKVILQQSCHKIFALFIIGETSLTSIAIQKAIAFAFPIVLLSRNMKFITAINSGAEGNTVLRTKQYAGIRNLEIAKCLVKMKIENQCSLLNALRYKSQDDCEAMKTLKGINVLEAEDIFQLLGHEGFASKTFFSAYFRPMSWTRREPRCKRDIYNLLLDIGYTYLFNFLDAMLALYGFDRYYGVFHTCFYQRKSLVCDIIEPFRCIIDRRLRKAYNLKQISPDDFFFKDEQFHLAYAKQDKYIRLFMKDILEQKENIFKFCQSYYRWFMQDRPLDTFPKFSLENN
ncbi:MAG: type V CRISPR-associated endonuclease Cas1 [Lentisphaeria bacterium]|nr:type V CRISPR-associated endonuclease Cas1 [Lentisphaeria bacterium]